MNRIKIYIIIALIITSILLFYYCDSIQENFGNYHRRYRRNRRRYRHPYMRFNPYYYYDYQPMFWYNYLTPWSSYYWRRPYNYSQVSPILD